MRSERPLPKSVGRELTFDDDINDGDLLRATLLSLLDHAVAELHRKGPGGAHRGAQGALRHLPHRRRRRTLPHPASAVRPLYETATDLLDELDVGARSVRLVGVSVSSLTHNAFQLTMDDGWREVALGEAVDKVRQKYGFKALTLAGGAPAPPGTSTFSLRRGPQFHPDAGGAAEAASRGSPRRRGLRGGGIRGCLTHRSKPPLC